MDYVVDSRPLPELTVDREITPTSEVLRDYLDTVNDLTVIAGIAQQIEREAGSRMPTDHELVQQMRWIRIAVGRIHDRL